MKTESDTPPQAHGESQNGACICGNHPFFKCLLEAFDAVGRYRSVDSSTGAKIDDVGELKDGTKLQGIDGLRQYLATSRPAFYAQFCRKLLGYALGRQTLPSDRALLGAMQESLKRNGGVFSAAVCEVITSRQFLNRRYETTVAAKD